MKELPNNHKDKRGLWRKAAALAGGIALLTACEQQPPITEGTVFKKEHIERRTDMIPMVTIGKISRITYYSRHTSEKWRVQIAQCPKGELPSQEKIEKECKTSSFDIPQEVYNSLQIDQHVEIKFDCCVLDG